MTLVLIRRNRDDGGESLVTVEVTRAELKQPSVYANTELLEGKRIGKITISLIGESTDTLFTKEIRNMRDQQIDGLILDLR